MEVSERIRQQLAFFGITPENAPQTRVAIFTQIHEICFHGKGGYDWNTVYNMPIWLRRFTFNKINGYYKEEKENMENPQNGGKNKSLISPDGKVNTPDFQKPNPPTNKNKSSYK